MWGCPRQLRVITHSLLVHNPSLLLWSVAGTQQQPEDDAGHEKPATCPARVVVFLFPCQKQGHIVHSGSFSQLVRACLSPVVRSYRWRLIAISGVFRAHTWWTRTTSVWPRRFSRAIH